MRKFCLTVLVALCGAFVAYTGNDGDGFSMTAEKRLEILRNYDDIGNFSEGMAGYGYIYSNCQGNE